MHHLIKFLKQIVFFFADQHLPLHDYISDRANKKTDENSDEEKRDLLRKTGKKPHVE